MSIALLHTNTQCKKVTVRDRYFNNRSKLSTTFEEFVEIEVYPNLWGKFTQTLLPTRVAGVGPVSTFL